MQYACEDYDINKENFSNCICRTCCLTLKEANKNVFKRPMPKMPLYQDIILPKNTRSRQNICNCFVCLTGRCKRHIEIMKGRRNKQIFDIIIDSRKGKQAASVITSLPRITPSEIQNTKKICIKCMAEIGRGKSHKCKKVVGNFGNMIKQLPDK